MGANEQDTVFVAIEIGADLSGKVHADVENLIGVCEHKGKRRRKIEAAGNGFRFELGSEQPHSGLQHGIDLNGGKPGRSLTGKREQAGNQRGCAANLLADLCSLELLLGWQVGGAEQVGVSQHGGQGIVDLVGCSAHQLTERGQLLGLNELVLQVLEVVKRTAGTIRKRSEAGSRTKLVPGKHHTQTTTSQKTTPPQHTTTSTV